MSEEVTVGTGVKFRIKDVPAVVFRDIQRKRRQERPRPPVAYIEEKGREEVNENDPNYLDAVAIWDEETEMKLMDFVLITGTEVLEVPKGIRPINDNSWTDELSYLGVNVPLNGNVRYLHWLKYVACPDQEDLAKLMLEAVRKLGVPEADVAEAAEIFRNREARRADSKPSSKARRK